MATFVGISLLGGYIWRRANRWGALASIIAAFAVNFYLYYRLGKRLDSWDPDVFLYALLAGTAALIFFSLITSPEPKAKIRDLFARLEVSTDHTASLVSSSRSGGESHELEKIGDGEIETLARKTEESGDRLLLIDIGRFWKPRYGNKHLIAYRHDLTGLLWCWGVVLVLIAIAYGILSMG